MVQSGQLLTGEATETETQGILKDRGTYETQRSRERKIVFADDTVGGSESELTSSSDSESEPEMSMSAKGDSEEFSSQVVGHFVKKVIKMKSQDGNDPDLEDSDSEQEFLQSLNVRRKEPVRESPTNAGAGYKRNNQNSGGKADENESDNEDSVQDSTFEVVDIPKIESENDATGDETKHNSIEESQNSEKVNRHSSDNSAIMDVTFLGKLVRTQVGKIHKEVSQN